LKGAQWEQAEATQVEIGFIVTGYHSRRSLADQHAYLLQWFAADMQPQNGHDADPAQATAQAEWWE